MLEYFKSEMLHTFELQMDTMKMKIKKEEVEMALAILFPRCTKRHPRNKFPLNVIEDFLVYEENHVIEKFPSFPSLKFVYQGAEGGLNKLCFINQRRTQGPQAYQKGMQGSHYSYYYPNKNAPLQPWYSSNHPYWSTPSYPYAPPYPPQLINHAFQPYPPQSSQWGNTSQGWGPQIN